MENRAFRSVVGKALSPFIDFVLVTKVLMLPTSFGRFGWGGLIVRRTRGAR